VKQLRGTEFTVKAVRRSDGQYFYARELCYQEVLEDALFPMRRYVGQRLIAGLLHFKDPEHGGVGPDAIWSAETRTVTHSYDEDAE
jgi:hypothetical protein